MRPVSAFTAAACLALSAAAAQAQDLRVQITPEMPSATFQTPEGPVEVVREQAEGKTLDGDWAIVSRDCPPFCIQPMTPAEGVTTVGELELIEMVASGDALLIDSRTSDWYTGGTIPGSINIPYTQSVERMAEMGCEPDFDGEFDCTEARNVILFCNGLWCGQSPTAIRAMINAGFPAERIFYYRGGMQEWRLLGFNVIGGEAAASGEPAPTDPVAATAPTPEEAATPGAAMEATEAPVNEAANEAAGDESPGAGGDATEAADAEDENPVTDGRTEEEAERGEAGDAPLDPAAEGADDAAAAGGADEAAPPAAGGN